MEGDQLRARRPDVCLVIVGDGPEREELESRARSDDLRGAVSFLGSRSDVPEILPAFDVFVLSSLPVVETQPVAVLESMAACLPVVATRVGGNPEAIIDGETGWLVAPRKPEELAMKIMDLLEDPEKAEKWGEAGRRRVEQNFSCEKMVAEFVKLYCKTER